jgi:AcrR family transcriptional regulator
VPRITGPDIATHVARQEAAVVRAAVGLFADRGYAAVTLADIAAAVGLARTSLYRYFPDKDHILLAWLRSEIDELVDRSQAIAGADLPATTRLVQWFHLHLDYIGDPDHQLFTAIAAAMSNLTPDVRAEVVDQHQRLYATVNGIVADALSASPTGGAADGDDDSRDDRDDRDPEIVAALVLGMFRAAGDAISRGADRATVGAELDRSAIALLLSPGSRQDRPG